MIRQKDKETKKEVEENYDKIEKGTVREINIKSVIRGKVKGAEKERDRNGKRRVEILIRSTKEEKGKDRLKDKQGDKTKEKKHKERNSEERKRKGNKEIEK